MRSRRWLTLGIGVKRYLLLIFLGTVVLALAMAMFLAFVYRTIDIPGPAGTVVYYVTLQFLAHPVRELTVGALGLVIAASGAFLLGRSVLSVVVDPKDDLAEILYQNRRLQRGPRVVAIGGGTGLGVLLRGLKGYTNNITAVVTVADDGGSSGRLREELGLMPPGDIRQCLAALADSESLMQDVMEYRFSRGQGLQGHSLGNLLIAAMTDLNQGNFERGVNDLSGVLRIRGRILPSTLTDVRLAAQMTDGSIVRGESRIRSAGKPIRRVLIEPRYVAANEEAVKELLAADMIVLGPGSVHTSVLPNLLVGDIAAAVRASNAVKVYVCNVATEPGETDGYSLADHVTSLTSNVGPGLFQYTLVNNNTNLGVQPGSGSRIVECDPAVQVELLETGVQAVMADVVDHNDPRHHDSKTLADALVQLYEEASQKTPTPLAAARY
ncbi:MAG: YvcK family protein [Chloroflexota bacterium]|nr:YvcK family protein [Chloroflexota bacterium]MDE2898097.1 YvcK family protein [Chloroflexota bacterium]